MRKLFLVLAVLTLTACSEKDYYCNCSYSAGTGGFNHFSIETARTKAKAKKLCDDKGEAALAIGGFSGSASCSVEEH